MVFPREYPLKSINKIDSIQALRGFAALGVMLAHGSSLIYQHLDYQLVHQWALVGVAGVDVFFVLSGFIILHTALTRPVPRGTFLRKRFLRIYPVYWIILTVLILYHCLYPSSEHPADRGSTILGSILLFPQKDYVLGIAWTLSFEIIFYLFFALTFFVSARFFYVSSMVWGLAIGALAWQGYNFDHYTLQVLFSPMILEFFWGCGVAYCFHRFRNTPFSRVFLWVGGLFFILMLTRYYVSAIGMHAYELTPIRRMLYFGFPAACLIYGLLGSKIPISPYFVSLGNASYSLYLLHASVLSLLIKFVLLTRTSFLFSSFVGSLILFATTIAIASAFYLLIEKPLIRCLNKGLV